jgi:hypothetical protein
MARSTATDIAELRAWVGGFLASSEQRALAAGGSFVVVGGSGYGVAWRDARPFAKGATRARRL